MSKQTVQTNKAQKHQVSLKEIAISSFCALIGIATVAGISSLFIGSTDLPVLVASMGAAAVLVFAAPNSSFSQPWPLIGGHIISAFVGVCCAMLIPNIIIAAAVATALAIFFMFVLRCPHPPGGAAALLAVLGGEEVRQLGFQFVLTPIALNAFILLAVVLLINKLVPGRRYPVATKIKSTHEELADLTRNELDFSTEDLSTAMREMGTFIDVSQEDLNRIYALATLQAQKRRLGKIPCHEIMTRDVLTVEFGSELEEVWRLMQRHKIKSLPVIDPARKIIGIITVTDFIREAGNFEEETISERLNKLIKRTQGFNSEKPEVAGQIMTSPVISVPEHADATTVVPLFSQKGIHHIPVVDNQEKLIGMITRHDLMRVIGDHELKPSQTHQ